jgi:hypothetical protein
MISQSVRVSAVKRRAFWGSNPQLSARTRNPAPLGAGFLFILEAAGGFDTLKRLPLSPKSFLVATCENGFSVEKVEISP